VPPIYARKKINRQWPVVRVENRREHTDLKR
jgi:hypothetical protein